jgi:hypothetical protein
MTTRSSSVWPMTRRPVADAVLAVEQLLEHDDVALALEVERQHDVHRLVEHDLLAAPERVELDGRADGDAHLAAAVEDVDVSSSWRVRKTP